MLAGVALMALGSAWVWFGHTLVVRDAAALYAAGVVFGDIHFRFTWNAGDRKRPGGGPEEAPEEATEEVAEEVTEEPPGPAKSNLRT